MKKSCLLLLFACGVANSHAQSENNSIPLSPGETFAERKGTLLEKRYDEVEKVGYLNVQIEYLTDVTKSDKMQCIRFDIQLPNNSSGPSALLDTNELNGIIGFLNYITTSVINRPPADPNTDISYTDNYNLQVGCFWQKTNGWTFYLRTDADNPATETDIQHTDIAALLKTLNLAKTEIKRS